MRIVRRLLTFALLAGIMVFGWLFASNNEEPVAVSYVVGVFPPVPAWGVVLAAFSAGALLAFLMSSFQLTKKSLVARRYRKTAEGLESEIHQMRNLPLVANDEGTAGAGSAATSEPERSG